MKIAAVFPGQGSQYVGMGEKLYKEYSTVRNIFEEVSDALSMDFKKLCFDSKQEEMKKTENTQPALLLCSYAAFRVFSERWNIVPEVMAGHSLGEISALTCAEAIDLTTAVKLVKYRAECNNKSVHGTESGMAAVLGGNIDKVKQICNELSDESGKVLGISNINSEYETVIAGDLALINKFIKLASSEFKRIVPLNISGAFHSPLMQKAYELFKEKLKTIHFNRPKYPIISNVTGTYYGENADIVELLSQHLIKPVLWYDTMLEVKNANIDLLIEFGAKQVLTKITRNNFPSIKSFSTDEEEDIIELKKIFYKEKNSEEIEVDNRIVFDFMDKSLVLAVTTRNYSEINEQEYSRKIVEPYKKIQQMKNELQNSDYSGNIYHIQETYDMIKSILSAKLMQRNEYKESITDLLTIVEPYKERLLL
ncbi:MAG: ACP S-malonyltransferase [Bacteroidales bacterium]|nr:ACP S-malonyltransferase [Bacteroidales bacterium]